MEEKVQDKKILILQSSLELIAEQGFYSTPMSQIAKKAKVAVGTIYLYFPTKEDLINTLYLDVKSNLANYVLKDYSETVPVKESFLRLLHNIIDYFVTHPKEFAFIEQYSASPLITTHTKDEGMNIFKEVRNLFKQSKEDKILKDLPIEILITLINGAALSLIKLCLFSNDEIDKDTLDASLDAIWDTIKL